jgi:HEAT repeat protein
MKSCFEGDQSATAAVRQIGTNALPSLTRWLVYEPSKMELRVTDACERRIPNPLRDILVDRHWKVRPDLAEYGLRLLGPEAKPAIPELVRALADHKKPGAELRITRALRYIGEDSLPPLVTLLTNRANPKQLRVEAVHWICSTKIFNDFAVTNLVRCLQDRERDVAIQAALVLAESRLEPDVVIPFLTNAVHAVGLNEHERHDAVEYFNEYGQTARPALPTLIELMSDPSVLVRDSVTNALSNIAPEVLKEMSAAGN